MPLEQRTVEILTVMGMRKPRRGNADITEKFTSTQAMASGLLFESRNITLATIQHYWKYILWLYSNSKNVTLAR